MTLGAAALSTTEKENMMPAALTTDRRTNLSFSRRHGILYRHGSSGGEVYGPSRLEHETSYHNKDLHKWTEGADVWRHSRMSPQLWTP